MGQEFQVLLEAIDDLRHEYFYHYPRRKARMVPNALAEWAPLSLGKSSIKSPPVKRKNGRRTTVGPWVRARAYRCLGLPVSSPTSTKRA
jgi:hypothetical protein